MTTNRAPEAVERLAFLDGWRGIAVLLVMVGHFFPVPGIAIGSFGVELFFVLSGRLMAEILFVRKLDAVEFLRRRFARVYPALLVFVLLVILPASLSVELMHTRQPLATPADAVAALTFTMNYAGLFFTQGLALAHTWSLAVEEHSYLILLALALACRRNARVAMYWMMAATVLCVADGVISSLWFGQDEQHVYWRTDVRIASILISASLHLAIREFDLRRFMHPATVLVGMPLALVLFVDGSPDVVRYGAVTLVLAWCVNALDVAPRAVKGALSVQPLVSVGLISYSLYLWQQPFYAAAGRLRDHGEIVVVALVVAAFCCAIGSYLVIERPARRMLNAIDLGRRPRQPDIASGSVARLNAEPGQR